MKRNFELDDFTVLRWDDKLVDLHNAYDLEQFGTSISGSEIKLTFCRNGYALDPSGLPLSVTLTCSGNVRIAFNNLGAIAAPLDKEGIEIAYFDQDCGWQTFLDEKTARRYEPAGLHISFVNGFVIRIFCDQATVFAE